MSKASTWLLEYKYNKYSQTGEDGIIAQILEIIPYGNKWCVEFGAWDGQYLTNTRNLIESSNFSAVLIEADKKRFQQLQSNYSQCGNVLAINQFVGYREDDNLDCILSATPIPLDFDLLSIDIDGNDYHVWRSFSHYKPKVVVIEFNPTIPTDVEFVQPADPSVNQGTSLLSLVKLGKEKGYKLVSVLPFNAFFVQDEYYPLFQLESNEPGVLRTNTDAVTYFFSGYDGHIFLRGSCQLPWHNIKLKESRIQVLPKFLRHYPENYSALAKGIYALILLMTNPRQFVKKLRKQFDRRASRYN